VAARAYRELRERFNLQHDPTLQLSVIDDGSPTLWRLIPSKIALPATLFPPYDPPRRELKKPLRGGNPWSGRVDCLAYSAKDGIMHCAIARRTNWTLFAFLLIPALLVPQLGCVKLTANLINAFRGYDVPPEFGKFKGKKVAVVCATDEGIGADANGILMARNLRVLFEQKIKDVELVSQEAIDQWNADDSIESKGYAELGRGLKVDYVLVVEMQNLKLREGQTLYRGKSDLSVKVYEMESGGKEVYAKQLGTYTFPKSGMPATEIDESRFRRNYLLMASKTVGRLFYGHDLGEDVGEDAVMLSL